MGSGLDPDKNREQAELARAAAGAVAYGEALVGEQRNLDLSRLGPDVLPKALLLIMRKSKAGWRGNAMQLCKTARKALPWLARRHKSLPKDADAMVARLIELAPLLRAAGIVVDRALPGDCILSWREWPDPREHGDGITS